MRFCEKQGNRIFGYFSHILLVYLFHKLSILFISLQKKMKMRRDCEFYNKMDATSTVDK